MIFQETEDCDSDDDHQASTCLRTVHRKETHSAMGKFEARLQKTEEDLKDVQEEQLKDPDIITAGMFSACKPDG